MTQDNRPEDPSAPDAPSHGHRVAVLDGVRGLAALTVLLYHFVPQTSADPLSRALGKAAEVGWCGVDLFFVLSGFLITGILLDARERPHYFRNFYARRSLRIFPLYYGTLAAVFLLTPLVIRAAGLERVLTERLGVYYDEFKYLQAHQLRFWLYATNVSWPGHGIPDNMYYFLGHFWSLAVEEHFYLVWPAVVLAAGPRRLPAVCVAFVLAPLALRVFATTDRLPLECYVSTPFRTEGLAVGGLLAVLARSPGGLSRLARPARWVAFAAFAALAAGFAWEGTLSVSRRFTLTAGLSLFAVGFGAFLVLSSTAPAGSLLARVMGGRVLRFFGKYSYALYVYNRLLMLPVKRLAPADRLSAWLGAPLLGSLAHTAIGIGVTVVVAWLSWHLYEKHFLKLKRYFP
jgi:peptidoglycan/LPS O-acetylase OafA/YrhL